MRIKRMVAYSLVALYIVSGQAWAGPLGNVYEAGDVVSVPVPDATQVQGPVGRWQFRDEQLEVQDRGDANGARVELGELDVGWYRLEFLDAQGDLVTFTTAAVLEPLSEDHPSETPIALDVSLSWIPEAEPEEWPQWARLTKMTGVGWVRDRMDRRVVQPEPDVIAVDTDYVIAAQAQHDHELNILQVFHSAPTWSERMQDGQIAMDLRDTWRFCKALATHYGHHVPAGQPGNEGNAPNFGAQHPYLGSLR